MIPVAVIVEGHGDVKALPVLLRRLGPWLSPQYALSVQTPIRIHRDRFLKRDEEFRKHVLLAASKSGSDGLILILLDADDDCPAKLGSRTLERARAVAPRHPISVVVANREFEAWFIAAARSLEGKRKFSSPEVLPPNPDTIRNAKGWIGKHMPSGRNYREIADQPAFAATYDLETARNHSRSFRKLCKELETHCSQFMNTAIQATG